MTLEGTIFLLVAAPPAQIFYATAAATTALLWLILSVGNGGDIHRRALQAPLCVRPTWLPVGVLPALHRRGWLYISVCHAAPLSLAAAAVYPESRAARLAAALIFSAYSLAESSITHSHRDYPTLYCLWALVLMPSDELAAGAALGVCIHFIASSGWAKVLIGGARGWSHPDTMRGVLRAYGKHSVADSGPASKALCEFACSQDWLLVAISVGTLVFECVLVPAALLLPPTVRWTLVLASVALHLGIASMQSLVIGLAFLPNVAPYVLGFASAGADVRAAVVVCATSAAAVACRRGHVLPEDWPVSPFALFAWNHQQWGVLFARFKEGDTRLILRTDSEQCSVGATVVGKWGANSRANGAGSGGPTKRRGASCYDAWEQSMGETLVFGGVLRALELEWVGIAADGWNTSRFCANVSVWLQAERRLVDIYSGRPLTQANFVRVERTAGAHARIAEVLC